jgi:hypothetical protein
LIPFGIRTCRGVAVGEDGCPDSKGKNKKNPIRVIRAIRAKKHIREIRAKKHKMPSARILSEQGSLDDYIAFLSESIPYANVLPSVRITTNFKL